MNASTFDRWVAAVGHRRTRRGALGMLGGVLLSGLLSRWRNELASAAQVEVAEPPTSGLTCAAQGLTNCGIFDYCFDTLTDPRNCGDCWIACNADEVCDNGVCSPSAVVRYPPTGVIDCGQGLTDCGGQCTDTYTDSLHCGGCWIVCTGAQLCDNGVCRTSAEVLAASCAAQGLADCVGGDVYGGVSDCVDLNSDRNNCGACGITCYEGYACVNGACV
jgi:hypothetical protein